ncbi:hypothetical protein SARC_15158, partial [Sphaeroforma arctica JP610]
HYENVSSEPMATIGQHLQELNRKMAEAPCAYDPPATADMHNTRSTDDYDTHMHTHTAEDYDSHMHTLPHAHDPDAAHDYGCFDRSSDVDVFEEYIDE